MPEIWTFRCDEDGNPVLLRYDGDGNPISLSSPQIPPDE